MRMLMIDNYDSFTFNLVQLFSELGIEVAVFRNDKITLGEIEKLNPAWICISPGPKAPAQAGLSKAVVAHFSGKIPILGVCLGMQVINEVFGGFTRKAPRPMHGKQSLLHHGATGLFEHLPSPFPVARYHSLCVDIRSQDILTTGMAEDGVVMAIQHCRLPVYGAQFHPESFLSAYGLEIAQSFLAVHERWRPSCRSFEKIPDRFPRYVERRSDRFRDAPGEAA